MQMISLLLISLAHCGALGAPVGAAEPSVAQDGADTPSLGAQRTFHLFYPELPTLRPAKESTTEVAVIHLQETDNFATMGEKTPENILEMIPKELLDSNKKIKPINVHIIEHDDFIDYEIEFVELSDNHHDLDEGIGNGFTPKEAVTYKIPTTTQKATSRRVTPLSFVNLLKSARREHRQRDKSEVDSKIVTTRRSEGSTVTVTESSPRVESKHFLNKSLTRRLSGKTLYENAITNLRRRNQIRNDNKTSVRNLVNPAKSLSHQLVSQNVRDPAFIKNINENKRFLPKSINSGKRSKPETIIKTTRLKESTERPVVKIQPTTTMQAYQQIETSEDIPSITRPQLWSSIHPSNDSPTPTSLLSYMTSSMMSYQDTRTPSVLSYLSDSSVLPAYIKSYRFSSSGSRMSTYSHFPSISTMSSYTLSTISSYSMHQEPFLSTSLTSSLKPTSLSSSINSKYATSMSKFATLSSFGKLPESTKLVSFQELSSYNKFDEKIIDDEEEKSYEKTIENHKENTVEFQTNISMQDISEYSPSHTSSSKSLIEEMKHKLITISYDLTKHYEEGNSTTDTKELDSLLTDKNNSTIPIMEEISTDRYAILDLEFDREREGEDDEVEEEDEDEENDEGEENNESEDDNESEKDYEEEEDDEGKEDNESRENDEGEEDGEGEEGEEGVDIVKPNVNRKVEVLHEKLLTEDNRVSNLEGASKRSDNKTTLQENIDKETNELNQQASEKPIYRTSTTLSLMDLKHALLIPASANLTGGHLRDTKQSSQDMHFSKSTSVVKLHTSKETSSLDEQKIMLKESKAYAKDVSETERSGSHKIIHIFETDSEHLLNIGQEPTKGSSEKNSSQPERSPKLITGTDSLSQLGEHSTVLASLKILDNEVTEGQKHTDLPCQEHKEDPGEEHDEDPVEEHKEGPGEQHEEGHSKEHREHPGQDNEEHPGQYHEHHPGQYNEQHPGQYLEVHPGQYNSTEEDGDKTHDNLGVENVTVDFEHGQESRIYNVQANAGDFIIGEVGKIDINSGQTLQGVRYTALEGEVDEAQILDILEKYFGARTR